MDSFSHRAWAARHKVAVMASNLTPAQAVEIKFSTDSGFISDNRIGAALARKGLAYREREYVPKVWQDPLSVGYMEITYRLTDEGESVCMHLMEGSLGR